VPSELSPGSSVSIALGKWSIYGPAKLTGRARRASIFVAGGNGAILDGRSNLVTANNPARIGDTLQIFANGLGAPTRRCLGDRRSVVAANRSGNGHGRGVNVPVAYQGLAPGFVGLYQVNVVLVSGVPTGGRNSVVITQNGVASNPALPATIRSGSLNYSLGYLNRPGPLHLDGDVKYQPSDSKRFATEQPRSRQRLR